MVRPFFSGGAVVAFILSCDICMTELVRPPVEAHDFWHCIWKPIAYGQKSCVEVRNQVVTKSRSNGNGNGWKIPVFCNQGIRADVARQMLSNAERDALKTNPDDAPPDYELFPGVGLYKVHLENKTWAEAKQICADEGVNTQLVIPSTVAEYAAVTNVSMTFLPPDVSGMFVGMAASEGGEYKTMFDQPLCTLPLVLWYPGEPNSMKDSKKCVGVARNQGNMLLATFSCDSKLPFICEWPLPGRISDSYL